jgi:hypothetical protein
MWCDDPLVRAFRRLGYNVLRIPSASFPPLLLLESDGSRQTRPIGPLEDELPAPSGPPIPEVRRDDAAPDIAVRSTRRLGGELGVEVLQPILALMGAPAIAGALSGTRKLSIVLRDVRRDWVQPGSLARYLESGSRPASKHVRKATEDSRLFVVTSVLKSTSLAILVDRNVAQTIQAQGGAPGIPLNVDVGQSRESADTSVVVFTGQTPLTFAFQAVRLVYEDGVYSDYASAHGLSGYAWSMDAGPAEGMLLLNDDLNEIEA